VLNPFDKVFQPSSLSKVDQPSGLYSQHSITLAVAIGDKFEDIYSKELDDSEVGAALGAG